MDSEKAALHGVSPAAVAQTVSLGGAGTSLGSFHEQAGPVQVPVVLELPLARRTDFASLLSLEVSGERGPVPVFELVRIQETRADSPDASTRISCR